MTQNELRKIKSEQSEKYNKMTNDEKQAHATKIIENHMILMGKENFIPTDKPNVWRHVPKNKG